MILGAAQGFNALHTTVETAGKDEAALAMPGFGHKPNPWRYEINSKLVRSMSGSRISGRVKERIERAAQVKSFEESVNHLENLIDNKGWLRTTDMEAKTDHGEEKPLPWTIHSRFLESKRATESKGVRTHISTAGGRGVFETKDEARAAITCNGLNVNTT